MSPYRQDDAISGQIIDAAAAWFVEFRTGEPDFATRRAFDTWVRKSPEHVRAYLELFPLWDDTAGVEATSPLNTQQLIQLARADSGNLLELPAREPLPGTLSTGQRRPMTRLLQICGLAAALVVVAIAGWLYLQRGVYATGIGEQRILALEDGSTIELNARSRLEVRFNREQRRIEILDGQALFDVAKDSRRPFVVASDDTQVLAVGTQFDVYKMQSGTRVTVLEGRVLVSRATPLPAANVPDNAASGKGLLLAAGDQATATTTSIDQTAHPDLKVATAWREHRLVFSATPLGEVADEFNRYNDRQLVIHNAAAAPFEVSGAFSMTDLPSLLRFLRAQPNITIKESHQQIDVTLNR